RLVWTRAARKLTGWTVPWTVHKRPVQTGRALPPVHPASTRRLLHTFSRSGPGLPDDQGRGSSVRTAGISSEIARGFFTILMTVQIPHRQGDDNRQTSSIKPQNDKQKAENNNTDQTVESRLTVW